MARLLVQLKLRLLANALRASTGAQVAFIFSTLFAVVVAVGVFYLLSILGGGIAAADLATAIFCLFGLAWLILPIVVFGLDSTLDPATLALSVSATVVPPARQRRLGEQHALGINVLPGDGTLPSSLRRARTERRARRNVKSELVAVTIRRLDVALAFRP